MTRNITLAMLPILALTACGTPQEQCIRRNTDEYRNVSSLLAEVEGNLARGYAYEERLIHRTDWRSCPYSYIGRDGQRLYGYRPCMRDVVDTHRQRVPIDPAVETRKRDHLAQRRNELARQANAAVATCRAAHPE